MCLYISTCEGFICGDTVPLDMNRAHRCWYVPLDMNRAPLHVKRHCSYVATLFICRGTGARGTVHMWRHCASAYKLRTQVLICEYIWTAHTNIEVEALLWVPCEGTVVGWPRWVGAFKLYVPFAREPYKGDDILQKRPIILRSLLIVATPYEYLCAQILTWGGYSS